MKIEYVKLSYEAERQEAARCLESAMAEYAHFNDDASGKRLLSARSWYYATL